MTVWFPTPENPTAQTFVRSHAAAAARHHDVTVLHLVEDAGLRAPASIERLSDPEVAGETPVWRVGVDRRRGEPGTVARIRAARRAAAHLGLSVDLVHAHMIESAAPAMLLAHRADAPWVLTEHYSGFATGEATRAQSGKVRWLASRADCVLPVSEALAATLREHGLTARTVVVANPVDAEVFHLPDAWRPADGTVRLLAVGRLHPVKGFDLLLKALAQVDDLDWTLDVIGDGPDREHLVRLADGLLNPVRFHGALAPARVAQAMRQADLLVAPSRYDNFPTVLLEASLSGLPFVATSVGGIPEIVTQLGHGHMIPPESPTAILDSLRQKASSEAERRALGLRARDRWSLDAVGSQLDGIYRSVLQT